MEPWLLHLLKRLEAGVLGRRRIWRSPWSSVVQRGHRSLGLGRSALGSSQPKTQAPGVFPGPPQGGLIGRQGPRCAALCKVDKTVGDQRTGPQSSRVPGPHSQEQPREARGWPDPSRHPKMAASETQEGWYGPNVITQICGSEVLTRCLKGSWFHTVSSHSCAVVGSVGLGQEAGLSAQLFRLAEPQFPHR